MRTSVRWSEAADAVDGIRPPINSLCYSPSGDYVVASCGVRVLVYAASTGTLLHALKGHQDTVYCLDYCFNGKHFSSGGADRTVIVWSSTGEGIVKYQHKDSIQALAYNPTSAQLVSISTIDWGMWDLDQPKVSKYSLPSKGLCAAWTPNGKTLAIGMLDGTILILERPLEEMVRIRRAAPVWTLGFSPLRENGVDVLVVGSWDQRLSFYNVSGAPVGKERELDFDPCSLSFYNNGEYILLSGSNHKVTLFTSNGNRLVDVADADDWIWTARQRPRQQQICCGTNDGTISSISIAITPVHAIYKDKYVYRKNMTSVVVHQLSLDRKMTIPCNEYVRKLATFRDRLAVQFQERIVVFEFFYDDERTMRYQDIAQIRRRLECSLMCVTTNALVTCNDKRITMYDFQGNKRREWSMESAVQFIKVSGGMEGREILLVGVSGGQVMKVFVDNPFPTLLHKVDQPVRCADLNSARDRLAVIDEANKLHVLRLGKKNELLFTEANVTAVAWNVDIDDIIAFTVGKSTLNIKTGNLPAYQQTVRGIVVGFKANHIFNLHYSNLMVLEVPHSHALYKYVEQKDLDRAYEVACLGVTDGDWKMLGLHAMGDLRLDIARKAFTHIQDVKLVELLKTLELRNRQSRASPMPLLTEGEDATPTAATVGGENATTTTAANESAKEKDEGLLYGNILAFQGKYQDAARQFIKCGSELKAMEMFCDLKMWDEAKKICSDEKMLKDLIRQQARWAEDSQNFVEAASLYESCGDYAKAIGMMGQAGQVDKLMKMCRGLPKSEVTLITECANYFRQHGSIPYAIEAYERVQDHGALVQIYVSRGDWRNAFTILEKAPSLAREVYVPWASWLADNDRFDEALEAFRAAKWPKEATRLMETLAANSVTCRKFSDAAFYYIHLAEEYGQFEDDEHPTDAEKAARIRRSNECVRRGDIYYAFQSVYAHTTQPLPYNELSLFRTSKYLLGMCAGSAIPMNVGKAAILYTLSRIANRLEMVRTARTVFEKLQTVILPVSMMEQVDVETLVMRSKPVKDREELLDYCFRCNQLIQQLTIAGDRCPNCFHPCVRSFVNFECLPLVEFILDNDVTDEEAERIIVSGVGRRRSADDEHNNGSGTPTAAAASKHSNAKGWQSDTGANVINFEADNIDYEIDQQLHAMGRSKAAANKGGDPFFTQLQYVMRPGRTNGVYQPFVATADVLKGFRRDEVFIVRPPYGTLPVPNRYYRLMRTDVSILLCGGCQHFFISADYEAECMKGSGCPLCRYRPGKQVSRSMKQIMFDMEAQAAASAAPAL
ncbi:putative WD40 repeat protein [Leptomonas seymouri]|uniref:Intraflagellar transport protein 122 homolog n=1 Tax=Leptomonas seymouri TaxID=5684 RepID=A0A0N0P5R4_LEPSE|nr:putative WD40 repeat protein [Leptomonas seymouri]|eukprot:KPI86769.1 putative WD40 repeat protein [Leptomonas seymouri]